MTSGNDNSNDSNYRDNENNIVIQSTATLLTQARNDMEALDREYIRQKTNMFNHLDYLQSLGPEAVICAWCNHLIDDWITLGCGRAFCNIDCYYADAASNLAYEYNTNELAAHHSRNSNIIHVNHLNLNTSIVNHYAQ